MTDPKQHLLHQSLPNDATTNDLLFIDEDAPPPSYEIVAHGRNNPNSTALPADAKPKPTPPPLSSSVPRAPLPFDLPILNQLRNKRTILASASPRRKTLLSQFGLPSIEIVPSTFAENLPKDALSAFEYVLQTATAKTMEVYTRSLDDAVKGDPAMVIGADTIVVSHAGSILEKPRSEAEHMSMLKSLRNSGNGSHKVLTAVVAIAPLASARDPGYVVESHVEETTVRFARDLTDATLLAYVRTREGADKAGGYGVQGMGALLIEGIEGSWDNVVGLPIRATIRVMEKVMKEAVEEDVVDEFADDDEEDDA